MGQSLSKIYVHCVFGTKFRKQIIKDHIEIKLHKYISGILNNIGCSAIIINSLPDHIHLLFSLSKNYSISQVMEIVKKDSSKWMKNQGISNFSWQNGYGAFSISQSKVQNTKIYIENQKHHHAKISYQSEVDRLMKEYNVEQYSHDHFWK